MSNVKLSTKDYDSLMNHYSGNCFSCDRCSYFMPIMQGKPGAVEAYVRFMREERGETIKTVPA